MTTQLGARGAFAIELFREWMDTVFRPATQISGRISGVTMPRISDHQLENMTPDTRRTTRNYIPTELQVKGPVLSSNSFEVVTMEGEVLASEIPDLNCARLLAAAPLLLVGLTLALHELELQVDAEGRVQNVFGDKRSLFELMFAAEEAARTVHGLYPLAQEDAPPLRQFLLVDSTDLFARDESGRPRYQAISVDPTATANVRIPLYIHVRPSGSSPSNYEIATDDGELLASGVPDINAARLFAAAPLLLASLHDANVELIHRELGGMPPTDLFTVWEIFEFGYAALELAATLDGLSPLQETPARAREVREASAEMLTD